MSEPIPQPENGAGVTEADGAQDLEPLDLEGLDEFDAHVEELEEL